MTNFEQWRDEASSLWEMRNTAYEGNAGPGCPVGCVYCNQFFYNFSAENGRDIARPVDTATDAGISINTLRQVGNVTLAEIPAQDMMEYLGKSPLYTPKQTLIFENFTDPGLNWDKTLEMMTLAVQRLGHIGALFAITKFPVPPRVVEKLQALQALGGSPIIMMSYAGLPVEIEPGSRSEVRVDTMKRLRAEGIPLIHSLRPLIEGINNSYEGIVEVLDDTYDTADVIVPGGLVTDSSTIARFKAAGHPLADVYEESGYNLIDVFPREEEIMSWVKRYVQEHGGGTPVHKYVSCAISLVMGSRYEKPMPDRLAHWAGISEQHNRWSECAKMCTAKQILVCKKESQAEASAVAEKAQRYLGDMGYTDARVQKSESQEGLLLVVDGKLPVDQLFALTALTGWYVNNLPSKEIVLTRGEQVIKDKMGLSLADALLSCELIDGVWQIVTDEAKIGSESIPDITKWLRGILRARLVVTSKKVVTS